MTEEFIDDTLTKIWLTSPTGKRVVQAIVDIAIARVGKGPYVLNPTTRDHRRFAAWRKRYSAAIRNITEEDLLIAHETKKVLPTKLN